MLRGGDVEELLELKREGLSVRQISRLTGYDRKTVQRYLVEPCLPRYGPRVRRASKLDPHREYIEERLKAGVWNASVLLRELRTRGYEGGYSILKEHLSPMRKAARVVAVRRFETAPGQQAQVDWGSIGTIESEEGTHRLSGFVMTLGCSRAIFAGVSQNEKLPAFLRMHEEAFQGLGGVPHEILYDRCKTVLLGLDERGEFIWNSTFVDFARYWGFVPRVCRGYRPQTKGKVEAGIKYLKGNFLCGRSAQSVEDLSCQLRAWTAEVANQRRHGTTFQVITEALALERPHLQPLGSRASYPLLKETLDKRSVARDSYVNYKTNRYSVPFEVVGKEVVVQEVDGKLQVILEGKRLAEHPVCKGAHQVITVAEHIVGIPLAESGRPTGKNSIQIRPGAPEVEVRSLAQYEVVAREALSTADLAVEFGGVS